LTVSGIALYSALANNTISTNPSFRTDTPQLIEQLLANTTISLIARALWSTSVSADVVRAVNVFVYQPHTLWAGYGAAVGVTLLCMAVGLYALGRNGGGGGKAFSLIMATTRNPALDAVTNRALHEKDYRETYSNLRFRYTNLDGRDGNRLAFQES
jgi:multisubunit Na+/H+ antiporter MnhG subunit